MPDSLAPQSFDRVCYGLFHVIPAVHYGVKQREEHEKRKKAIGRACAAMNGSVMCERFLQSERVTPRLLAPLQQKRSKVLIVDDEQIMRDLLRLHLGHAGYEVVVAEDAVAAGHLVLGEKPDVVICDVEMPFMNGYEFVAALKADPSTRDIPVVFLTTDPNVADHAAKVGAQAYLNKPVLADRLLEIVALFANRA